MERLIENPRYTAAQIAAETGIELAYEADRAFDIMKGLEAAMKAYSSSHAIDGTLHHVYRSEAERTRLMPYRQTYNSLESARTAQHALFHDTKSAAAALIGSRKLGTEYLASISTTGNSSKIQLYAPPRL